MKNKRTYEVFNLQDYEIEVYSYKNDGKKWFECWLYKKGYGVKLFMFGMEKKKDWKDVINRNIFDYVDTYKEEFESGEEYDI